MSAPSSLPPPKVEPPLPTVASPKRPFTPFVSDWARQPASSWALSALLMAAVPATVKTPLGFPHLVQLPLFAAIFGGSGYMIQQGDAVNGAGTATAWSLTYLFLHGRKALTSRRPGPIALASAIGVSASITGYDYFVNT